MSFAAKLATGGILTVIGLVIGQWLVGVIAAVALFVGALLLKLLLFTAVAAAVYFAWRMLRRRSARVGTPAA